MNCVYRLVIILSSMLIFIACGGGGGGGGGPSAKSAAGFDEGWESAAIGSYSPAAAIPVIDADEGRWIIGDTVSEFPDCGPTPQAAEVISSGGGKALHLVSKDSGSSCSDNVWVGLMEVPAAGFNAGFSIPLGVNTEISFDESGSLTSPQTGSSRCLVKPCGDTVSLLLTDNNGNTLAYLLQRAAAATPNTSVSQYREILLDPAAGSYSRNLYADFQTIPAFVASGVSIVSVEFLVQEHGDATLDNLVIKDTTPSGSPGTVTVTEAALVGVWRRLDAGKTDKGKEYLSDGTGWLGNFSSGPFSRATPLTWSLSGVTLTDQRVDGTRVENVVAFDGVSMTTQRVDNGNYLHWKKQ